MSDSTATEATNWPAATPPRMIVAAQRHAARGWRVLPLHHVVDARCSCGNPKAIEDHDYRQGGKHPVHASWQKEASTDWATVAEWWRTRPAANIGIATGEASGIFVLDVDPDNGGLDSLNALEAEHGPLPATWRVETGSGGLHFYFAWPGFNPRNSAGKLGPGLDIRADRGQVVAPPSVSVKGPYTVRNDVEPAPAPAWLLDRLRPTPPRPAAPAGSFVVQTGGHDAYTRKALQAECDAITGAVDGEQNNAINTAAFNVGTLVGAGALGESEAREALLSAARAGNHPEGRALPTIDSGLSAGMAQPRQPRPPASRRDDFANLIPPGSDIESVDWGDIEDPFEPSEATTGERRIPGLLPEEFYAAREELRHIRQAGHSRTRSGDVAILATLTRLSGMVSHHIRADTGVAGYASLNLFGGILGPSGIGKSSGVDVADRLMPAPPGLDFRDGLPIGSGEGIAEIFMDTVEEPTGVLNRKGEPIMKAVRAQVRHNASFYIDEGAALTRLMKERSGSTLGETLRSAAVGQTLGQTNASKDTSRYIPSGSYSMGLLVGFQPETVVPLFEEVAEGTPQRFIWVQVIDPAIPDEQPPWPGELVKWRPVIAAVSQTLITFDAAIKNELRRTDLAKARGEVSAADLNPLDSHAPLMRVKVASLLAILAGRLHVNAEDWDLARMVWEASCAARDAVVAFSEQQRRLEQEKRTQARIVEEVRVEQAKVSAEAARTDKAVDRIATRIAVLVRDSGALSRSEIRTKFAGRDKKHMGDALAYAELREWVIERDGKVAPGPVQPT